MVHQPWQQSLPFLLPLIGTQQQQQQQQQILYWHNLGHTFVSLFQSRDVPVSYNVKSEDTNVCL